MRLIFGDVEIELEEGQWEGIDWATWMVVVELVELRGGVLSVSWRLASGRTDSGGLRDRCLNFYSKSRLID